MPQNLQLGSLLNKIILLIAFSLFISGLLTGCDRRAGGNVKVPLVYRVDVQQGNVIEQSMVNKLEPGMTKAKVTFIMGTPLLIDPFHSNRWEYVYSIEPGDGERAQYRVTLFFKNDKLTHLEGDIAQISKRPQADDPDVLSVLVTGQRKDEGFFGKWFGSGNKKKNDKSLFDKWFGSDDELQKTEETRDKETEKELEALAEDVNKRANDSILPLPERDAEQIERDFEVLEKTQEEF